MSRSSTDAPVVTVVECGNWRCSDDSCCTSVAVFPSTSIDSFPFSRVITCAWVVSAKNGMSASRTWPWLS